MPSKTAAPKAFAEQNRLRARLRDAVSALAQGFLHHKRNEGLRRSLKNHSLSGPAFFKKLLCLCYRIVFLAIFEATGALFEPQASALTRARYARDHGIFRFIRLCGNGRAQSRQNIWQSLCNAMQWCRLGSPRHGIAALGLLFEKAMDESLSLFWECGLGNEFLFSVFRSLFWERKGAGLIYTDISNIRMDELGEAYESLLELHPSVDLKKLCFEEGQAGAHERRGTGSYYTPPSVIARVLDQTLEPLLARAMQSADPGRALLNLRVCDPSCGPGFFLLAAGRRIAQKLAMARAAPKKAGKAIKAQALADVVGRSLYGVDINAMAVELCRISLWVETIRLGNPNLNISRHIRMANSLLGIVPEPGKPPIRKDKRPFSSHKPFIWSSLFPLIFSEKRHGFDVVVGNPPWIAHAGRAVQPMEPSQHAFLCANNPAFAGYRTTHGAFVYVAAKLLREGGRLGLVLPTSIADLKGYAPARRAHDSLCEVVEPLVDFGDGAFEGVFQPCMALVSIRAHSAGKERSKARPPGKYAKPRKLGEPWPLARNDISMADLALLGRLSAMKPLPADLFGERGFQTTSELKEYLIAMERPRAPFHTPIREGADVAAFLLGKPRVFANRKALGSKIRAATEYVDVPIVVRQTARFPIAAKNDGHAFRNSLLACFAKGPWTWYVLLSLLNSSLLRWFHYHAFRDARQGMPQVKIGHLRSIPAPVSITRDIRLKCKALCLVLSERNEGIRRAEQDILDALVFDAYGLSASERRRVLAWARSNIK